MLPVARDLWAHVPGYESAEENEHPDCEGKIASQAKESLREVVKQLGDDWEELSVLFFKPAAKMKNKDKEKDREREFTNRVSSVLTPSFRIEHTDAPVVRDTLLSNGLTPTTGRDWLIQWSGPGLRDTAYQEMNEFQRVNHFPGSTELTRKDRLWMNFLDMAETFGNEAFDFVPQTFVLPEQVQEFLEVYNKKNGLWIVKPHASSRGRGIFVLKDVADLPLNEVSVVSQYVHNPLLIQGYVLVTSYEPLRAYVYREGLVRFACRPYSKDPEHLSDAYRHLTNYSINKGSATFVENSEVQADNVGHKWSFSALNRHLKCTGVDVELMWSRIMDVIMKSLLAVEPVIGARTKATACHSHNCFELYGFDVLVDNELKPWLLEVNLSPSMQADSPLDWQIKGSLLADTFNLVGINRVSKHRLAEATRAKAKVLKIPGKPPGPPERHKAHRRRLPRHRSALLRRGLETMDATEEPMPPVALGALELEELRSAANALLECTRNRNFIRLFPTSRAVYHYAVIVDSQEAMKPWPRGRKPVDRLTSSQVLASLLFGPPPTHGMSLDAVPRSRAIFCCRRRPERPEEDGTAGQGEDGEETSTPLPRARAEVVKRVKSVATTGWEKSGVRVRVASIRELDPVTRILQEHGCRLGILEYLIRVYNRCSQLSDAEQQKASQAEVTARLDAFFSILQGTFFDDASVVERVQMACRTEIRRLAKGYGEAADGLSIPLAKLLPSMAKHSEGRQALEKLSLMTATELERFLLGSACDARFRALLENYTIAGRPVKSPHRGILRSRSAAALGRRTEGATLVAGPLSELLCLPLTLGRSETPKSHEKVRSNRRVVMMKRTPAESLMAAAAEAGDEGHIVPTGLTASAEMETVETLESHRSKIDKMEQIEKDKVDKVEAKSRPQSGRSRASSRPSSSRMSRPPSRCGRSRPSSAKVVDVDQTPKAKTGGEEALQLPVSLEPEPDSLSSFVSHMERSVETGNLPLSPKEPSPSRRKKNDLRTPLAALFPKGEPLFPKEESGSSPFAKSSRPNWLQFATYDIEL